MTDLVVYTDDAGERDLRAAFANVSSAPVAPGWRDAWKEFHRPVHAGGLWIGPPWIRPTAGERPVVVDPGRAFGTGSHPTTRLCIEALSRLERGSVLDAGCGSGVLSVAAVRLGFDPVHAVDVDEVAVEVARGTACANRVEIQVSRANVLTDALPRADILVANIERTVVTLLLERWPADLAVTSGYFVSEAPRAEGWAAVKHFELEGWAADVLARRH
jgi:ribosomal protein L11 methyltransferase